MRSVLSLGIISAVISLAFAQLDNNEPTHIIKFKTSVSRMAANDVLLEHHRNFLSSVRKIDAATESTNNSRVSAATLEGIMSLDHINLGPDFVAVAGVFSDHAFLEYLYQQSSIDYVEQNQIFKSTNVRFATTKREEPFMMFDKRADDDEDEEKDSDEEDISVKQKGNSYVDIGVIQNGKPANWGLARINQHSRGDLENYDFDTQGGNGVDVYVLDTGVYSQHLDFNGRAIHSANMVRNEDDSDMGGHGTHVSGKIIGAEYGVAKGAQVKSVKILNKVGDGSTSSLLKGIEYVIENAKPNKSVVNLSLSGPRSRLLDEALNALVLKHNVPVFVSAGNAGTDACFFSPSSNVNVFSVGSIDINDQVPRYSNVGECVAIYAPGSGIVSAYIGGPDSSKSMDGTSMAAPHVTGIAANLMARNNYANALEVYEAIRNLATRETVFFDNGKTSSPNNNLLAYNEVV